MSHRIQNEITDHQWEIPPSWIWTEIGNITKIIGGGTPSTTDIENFKNGNIPWITPADLSKYENKYISKGARNLSSKGFESCGAKMMPAGTVLLSSRAPIGYVAIAARPVSTNQGFKSFVLPDGLMSDYVFYYLKAAKQIILNLASGTTFLEISGTKAAHIPFPIAPLSEQTRIVAEIEKQFTRLDAAVDALKRVKANLKRYRASVLKAACEGRLVPTEAKLAKKEGRSYEPADVLLKRILKERRAKWEADQLAQLKSKGKSPKDDKWKEKYKEPAPPDTTHLSILPQGWVWASVGQVINIIDYRGRTPPYSSEGIPHLRSSNIRNGKIKWDSLRYVSHETFEKYMVRGLPEPGDILFTTEAPMGEVATAPAIQFSVAQRVMILHPTCTILSSPFLLYHLMTDQFKKHLLKSGTGTTVTGVSSRNFKPVTIIIPPMVEQKRIVEEIERRLSVIDEIETLVDLNLKKADRLRQSVLKRAFEGKLVPQNPNDEPASVLLDKIQEERIKSKNEVKPKVKVKHSSKTKHQKQKVK